METPLHLKSKVFFFFPDDLLSSYFCFFGSSLSTYHQYIWMINVDRTDSHAKNSKKIEEVLLKTDDLHSSLFDLKILLMTQQCEWQLGADLWSGLCPSQQFSRGRIALEMLKHIFSVFCKPPLLHGIVCPRCGPGKCFSRDLGQFLNPYWTATKMLTISQECFLSFFGCPVPFPLYSFLCSMHTVLHTYLGFFSLYLIFSLTFIFLFFCFQHPVSFYVLPGSISTFVSAVGSVLTSFLQRRWEIFWSHFTNSVCSLWHVFTPFSFLWPFPLVLWSSHLKNRRGNSSWYPAGSHPPFHIFCPFQHFTDAQDSDTDVCGRCDNQGLSLVSDVGV